MQPRAIARVVTACVVVSSCSGCITGSLATNTGPSSGRWSTANKQYVHAGEEVSFSFVLTKGLFERTPLHPYGHADYCLATIGSQRIEADLDEGGHYRFDFVISDRRSGEVVPVRVVAYRRLGSRDIMKIGDVWIRGEDPYDQPDLEVADDTLELIVYRSRIELHIEESPAGLDMAGGRLELVRDDGSMVTVLSGRDRHRGFRYFGPDKNGRYRVVYEPTADEVNRSGGTEVRFVVDDRAEHRYSTETVIETP